MFYMFFFMLYMLNVIYVLKKIYVYIYIPGSLQFIWLKFWNSNFGCYPLQVCWMCKASKGSRGDLENCYVNLDPQASWRATIGQDSPWQHQPEYSKLVGFDPLMISIDPMHCWHLGTGRDLHLSISATFGPIIYRSKTL